MALNVLNVKAKQWGSSIGVIIPSETVDELSIRPGEELIVEIQRKQNVLKELFGAVHFKKKTEDILREVREELEGELI